MILKTILASMLLAWSGGGPGAVQEVRIAQVGGETEIVVVTSGTVTYRDFALEEPPRLILDLSGAESGLPNPSYDAIRRGGVMRIRSSWFRPGVLRLVFDMAQVSEYDVQSNGCGAPRPGAQQNAIAANAAANLHPVEVQQLRQLS